MQLSSFKNSNQIDDQDSEKEIDFHKKPLDTQGFEYEEEEPEIIVEIKKPKIQ